MSTKANCSFVNAGNAKWHVGTGGTPVNLGGSLVAQAVDYGEHGCSVSESLIVTDCAANRLIVLEGGQPAENFLSHRNSVKALQRPNGPIALRTLASLDKIERVARAHDIAFSKDFSSWLASRKVLRKFDPFCGCKLTTRTRQEPNHDRT